VIMDKQKTQSIILRYIVEHKKLPLTRDEIDYVREQSDRVLFSGKNPVFEQYSFSTIIRKFSEVMIDRIQADRSDRSGYNRTVYDLSDYNKKVLTEDDYLPPQNLSNPANINDSDVKQVSHGTNIVEIFGIDTYDDLLKTIIPEKYYKKHYVLLDSKNRNRSVDDPNLLTWNYVPNKQTTNNAVTTVGSLEDIISMKIYQLIMPYDLNDVNQQSRISVLIKEFETQSSIVSESIKYHFVGRYIQPVGSIRSRLHFEDNKYDFYTPFKFVDTFTVQFKMPDVPIELHNDILPATFTYGNPTVLNMPTHYTRTGHYVYIEGFNTDDPVADAAIITLMNQLDGHVCTRLSDTTLSIAVDTTTVTPTVGLSVSVYLGSQRIIIPIEFTCVS
jgi:hypothetical protein